MERREKERALVRKGKPSFPYAISNGPVVVALKGLHPCPS